MKKLTKILPVCGVLVLAATGLAACGNNGDDEQGGSGSSNSIVVSTASAESDWYKEVLKDFNKKRVAEGKAEVKFEMVVHEENVVQTEVADWTKGPDVYSFVGDQMSTLYKKQALATVPPEYQAAIKQETGEADTKTFATYVNKMVGYPNSADNGYFLYYDKQALTENDVKTWDGIMAKATEERKLGYDMGDAWFTMGALFTFGADYEVKFTKQGNISSVEATFDTAKGLKAAKFITDVYKHYHVDKNLVLTVAGAPNEQNGMIACVGGSHLLAGFRKSMGDRLGCAKLPTVTIDGETKTIGSFLGYKLFGVNNAKKDADKIALSHEVARYLTSKEVQLKKFQDKGAMPANKELQELPEVIKDDHVVAIKNQVAAGAAHAQTTVPGKCWDAPKTFTTELSQKIENDKGVAEITDAYLTGLLDTMNTAIKASK